MTEEEKIQPEEAAEAPVEAQDEAQVEEKRIKPAVIRRRRVAKPAPKKQKSVEAPAAEAAEPVKEEKASLKAKKEPAKATATEKAAKPAAKKVVEKKAAKAEPAAVESAPAKKVKEVKIFKQEDFRRPPPPPPPKQVYRKGRKRYRANRAPRRAQQFQPTRPIMKTTITVPKAEKRVIRIVDAISVADLSQRIGVKAGEIIRKLMGLGIMTTVNQLIDVDAATLIAQDYNYEIDNVAIKEESLIAADEGDDKALEFRPPVVTVMGHVDHGKTSLLDAIRRTNVVAGEAGGITQHIGAYHVHLDKGDVTFLDTPGHEAFTAMRARGAKVTDIVVLVVAADDGVMPQTVEAINHAKAAEVPIIVAVNKIDLPQADPDKVKKALTEHGLVPEQWGGDTICLDVSAKQGTGIKELLDMLLLQAEMLDLKADHTRPASGYIVEARLDKGRGVVATVLVKSGTLKTGDAFVTGLYSGRVRAMVSDWGKQIKSAGPSMPVELTGFSGVPEAGEIFTVIKDEATAKQIAEIRQRKSQETQLTKSAKVSLADLFESISRGEVKEFNIIVKADVQGSIEAVRESLEKLSTDKIILKVIHSAAGGISEGDIMLAAASNAIVIGFNVRPMAKSTRLAEKEQVDVRLYDVIYNLVDDVKKGMEGMLEPIITEETVGKAEVRDLFRVSKVGTIAGCYVIEGKIARGSKLRLVRDSIVIYEGAVASLKRFKDDAKEVQSGYECGIGIEGYNDMKVGDVIEAYTLKEEAAKL